MVRIKICGIATIEDALVAADAGADALGFVFYDKSPRRVSPEAAARIVSELPPYVTKVGVFVDSPIAKIHEIVSFCKLDSVQLHGQESVECCQAFFPRVVKAFRVDGPETVAQVGSYRAAAYLLDAYHPAIVGGTGETFDWEIARTVSATRRVILAGGLNPMNVQQAIATVKPYGVDVSTGVERAPGKKDPDLVRAFIAAARLLVS